MLYRRKPAIDKHFPKDDPTARPSIKLFRDICHFFDKPAEEHKCLGCGSTLDVFYFPESGDTFYGFPELPPGRQQHRYGVPHTGLCMFCMNEMFTRLCLIYNGNRYKALYRICGMMNVYYSDELAHAITEDEDKRYASGEQEPVDPRTGFVDLYLRKMNEYPDLKKKKFWESENCQFDIFLESRKKNKEDLLTESEKAVRRQILNIYHYDPFQNEPNEDRPRLMEDLMTLISDDMANDLVKIKAGVEVVKTFHRIDKLGQALNELQKTPESIIQNSKQIKELIEERKKETDLVTAFSKDHGFAERYAISKSKGSNTLSAIVKDMNDKGYDRGAVNKFDIDTAAAIKQVSDISAESIFKQIKLTDSEYADMINQQAVKIKELRENLEKIQEELRLYKEKHLKQQLLDELKTDLAKKGISDEEIEDIISDEIKKNTNFRDEEYEETDDSIKYIYQSNPEDEE